MSKARSRIGKKASQKSKTRRGRKSRKTTQKLTRVRKQRGGSSDFQRPGAGLPVEKDAVVSMRLPSEDIDTPAEYHLISAEDAERYIRDERP